MSKPEVIPILGDDESARFRDLDTFVRKHAATFVEVGSALLEIREQRLYREQFDTFEAYCRDAIGMSDRRARQLIATAEVASNLNNLLNKTGTMVPVSVPTNERQARPLASLPPEQQADAWQEAVASAPEGRPTARQVEAVVDRKLGRPAPARINGRPAADPPEVAALRKAGRIAADCVVEIDEPDELDALVPEPPTPIPDEPEDAPDLESEGEVRPAPDADPEAAFLDGLPQRGRLAGRNRAIFDEQALAYLRLEPARRSYAHHAAPVLRRARRGGPFTRRVQSFLRAEHPRHWPVCPAVDKGGCGGTGEVPMLGECPKCKGAGFWIK